MTIQVNVTLKYQMYIAYGFLEYNPNSIAYHLQGQIEVA